MSALSGYLMRLVCAAVICAMIHCVAGGSQGIRRLTAGIFLSLTVLSPIGEFELPELDLELFHADAMAAADEGTNQAEKMRSDIILEACEAYIWNKAAEMGLELEIRMALDPEGMPLSVELTGMASPLERQKLTQTIVQELGIRKEDVTWKDPHQSSE